MSPRHWRFCLTDIIEAIAKIQRYVAGMDCKAFLADEKTQDAVVRKFILIGEAARHVPPYIVDKYADVPWQPMRDMRNFAVHVYWGVKPEVIWDTIMHDLPPLAPQLQAILESEGEEPEPREVSDNDALTRGAH